MSHPTLAQAASARLRRALLAAPVALVTLIATASAVCLATAPSAWAQAPEAAVAVVANAA